jgi:hypothetical protein
MDNQEIVFRGNSAAMRFISRHSLVPGRRQGLVSVTYRIFDTPDRGKVLGVYEYPLIIQGPRADNGQDAEAFQPLIEGLDEAVWTYRGLLPSGVADWQEDWPTEENQNLPQAVRLTLRPRGELPLRVIVRLADATGGR